jgi:choline/glycine/proline betaine transport protein
MGLGEIVEAVNDDISKPLFVVIENFGIGFFADIISFVALILIITYFVTSFDSGTLVVTTLIAMGREEPPVSYRVFWGMGEGAVAMVLLAPAAFRLSRRRSSRPACHSRSSCSS